LGEFRLSRGKVRRLRHINLVVMKRQHHRGLGIAEGLAKKGIRKFVMLNAHGGNSPIISVVATEARVRFAMLAVATSWTRFGVPDG
ncbi:creatininase family protein, partial [Rhizobium leguminosarum]|uniref:creatininase family protein n=1 Tax=Rhizobium leguminosarum TaxID=384 RepID=UPI003F9B8B0E